MTAAQKEQLLGLVERYVGNMADGHAQVRMDEVRRHLDDTWFAWVGGSDDDSVFYYRIHSPVVLIEFDHQLPVGTRRIAAEPERAGPRAHPHRDRGRPTATTTARTCSASTTSDTRTARALGRGLARRRYLP